MTILNIAISCLSFFLVDKMGLKSAGFRVAVFAVVLLGILYAVNELMALLGITIH